MTHGTPAAERAAVAAARPEWVDDSTFYGHARTCTDFAVWLADHYELPDEERTPVRREAPWSKIIKRDAPQTYLFNVGGDLWYVEPTFECAAARRWAVYTSARNPA